MSPETLEERRLKLEISKLEAETEKLLIETKALKKPLILRPSALVPVLVGIVTLIGSVTQWYKTNQELKSSKQDNQSLESYNEGLKINIEKQKDVENTELQKTLVEYFNSNPKLLADTQKSNDDLLKNTIEKLAESANKASILPSQVAIQFKGNITRELITALQEQFNSRGMPTPRPERIDKDYRNSIRFFHKTDKGLSEDVQKITEEFFKEKGCPINIKPMVLEGFENTAKEGTIEVWINHNCK